MKNIKLFATAMLLSILGTSFVEAATLHVQNLSNYTIWVHLKARHKNKRKRTKHNEGTFKLKEFSNNERNKYHWNYSTRRVHKGKSLQDMDIYGNIYNENTKKYDSIKTKISTDELRGKSKYGYILIDIKERTNDQGDIEKYFAITSAKKYTAIAEAKAAKKAAENAAENAAVDALLEETDTTTNAAVQLPSSTVLLPKQLQQ